MDFEYYCYLEGAICNKDYNTYEYAPCCIKCQHNCSNCIVSGDKNSFRCDNMLTKEELINKLILELNIEKEQFLSRIEGIDRKITILKNDLILD